MAEAKGSAVRPGAKRSLDKPKIWMHRTTKIPVTELNPHLICVLCGGYLIDATTIIECLHSFCRTCITRYLEGTKYCPICDVQVHKTRPLLNIRPDKTLQDLVYKLVPGLYKDEMKIRRKFYEEHPEAGPCQSANASEERGEVDIDKCPDHEDEQISLCLQHVIRAPPYKNESSISKYSKGESEEKNPDHRHLLCPAEVNVGHLKKFIKFKFELSDAYQIDVFHTDETLRDDYTLMDIAYLYAWKRRTPLKLFYRVRDVTLKPMTCLPEVTQDQPISDAETVTPEGKRKHLDKSGLVSAKKAKLAHDDEDADDEAENTAENDDKSADNADVSAESSDTVIYEQAGNIGDNENDSDKTVDCQVMMECEQTVKTDAGSSTQVASAEAATDGGNSQAIGDDKDIQCPSVEQKEVASKDVTPVSEGIQKGNPTTTDTITMSKNIFSIMAKEALSTSFVQSEAVATTSCEKTPAPATAAPQTPVTSQKPTTSVKPLPLNKAPGSTKTVLSQKRPGSLPPITINKRWIPNQVPVPKARPIAAKPASPPGGSGVSSPGKSGGSPKSSSPSSEPGSPGKGKLLVKGGKMGVPASLANTIGRTTTVSKTTPAVVKDKPPVKSLSPVAPAAKDEEKKDGGAVSPPTGKPAPVPTKNGASPPKVHMPVSRSKVTISKALLSSKPATPARKVAPKPPTSRVTPTSRIIPAGPALRPPASPVNQAVVIPSGLKTFTMRPAGTTANGFTTPGSVQVISPGGGLPPGPLTQIRFSGPLPGGKVPSTMVLTGSQVATLMGAPGVLRGPRTLAPSPATSPTSPSKVLNNSLPTGLSAVIDKLQYRSAKTLTFQPVVPGSTIMTSQPHTIMTPQPQTMMTSQPHTVMTAHPHVIMTSQPQTIIRSQPHRMMTSQAQHVHQPGATPGVATNKPVKSHQMAAPATVASTQIQVTAPAINVSKNQTTNIAPVLNSTAVSITVTGPPQAHVASSSNGAQTNTSVPMATTGTSTLGKQGSLDSAEDSQVSERDSQSEVEIEIENSPGGNNNNAVVDGGVEAAETDTGTQTSVTASPCPSSSPSTLRASPCVVVVSSIKSSDLNDSLPANSTSGGRPASRPDPGIEQMVVSVVEQADVAQLQSGDRESTQGKSSGSVSAASQAGASGVSCPPTPPAPPPPVPNSSVTAVVDIPAKQPLCQQPPSSNNISENQGPNSGGLGSGPSPVAPSPATHPRDMFTETPVDPGLYSSTSAGLIMLANVAGAAADRDSLVMPGTSLSPLKPALPPLPPPSPQQPARAPAPSVSVAPVVSKTSVETQTQTSDSLDEGLRRVPASLPLPANPAQTSGSRDRYESLAPPAGNPGEKEPPIKKLKMMCHGIDAERKVHSRSGQGHRRMQPRQLNNSSSSVNGGVTMGGRSSDPKCMTPPGGDKRFSPTAGRHQFSPTLPRPTLHVPMVTKNNYIQPVIGMTSPGSAVPPSITYFPTPVAASAPAPNQLLPIRPANQATIAPPIPKINMGRHGNGVRHGVARPMPNHNNNNKDYPRVNPVPNDPLANGYDAPLELTTKKGRDRKKSEEGIVKCPAKPPSTVVPNAALRP